MKKKRIPIALLIATALLAGCLGENPVGNNLAASSREAQTTKPDSDGTKPDSVYTKSDPIYTKPDPIYTKPDPNCTKPDPIYTKPDPIKVEPDPIKVEPIDPRCPKELPPIDCILACTDNGGGTFLWQCKDMSNLNSATTGFND